MAIHDITLTISPGMPLWPGDPPVELSQVLSMDLGADANLSRLSFSLHTGTHVDAPHHFINDHRTVESMPLEVLTGPCMVLHLGDEVDAITAQVLDTAAIPAKVTRLLFRTRNSARWARGDYTFHEDFVAVPQDGAEWLVRQGVRLVGVDYLSVAPMADIDSTHKTLLKDGIVVIEGLDLSQVEQGTYQLFCLPLKVAGAEGAPARAILIG